MNTHFFIGSRVETSMTVDYGPMSDLQRSPFFSDVVLSVGGWSFSVWKEKLTVHRQNFARSLN